MEKAVRKVLSTLPIGGTLLLKGIEGMQYCHFRARTRGDSEHGRKRKLSGSTLLLESAVRKRIDGIESSYYET